MNILFTVNTYFPLKDGVQFVTGYHAESLARMGHDVTVITLNHEKNKEIEVHNGVNVIRFNAYVKHSFYFGDKRKYQKLVLDLSKKTDVLINVCTQCPTTDWILPIIHKVSCKKILYLHGMYNFKWSKINFKSISDFYHKAWNNVRWFFFYSLNGKKFKLYDHVVQLHDFDYGNDFFKKKYGIQGCIIENAVDDRFFSNNNVCLNKNIVCVANYMDGKNQKFLLDAFYHSNLDEGYKLILVGSVKNDYYDSLVSYNKKLTDKYGAKTVEFLYGLNREDTINIIKNAWVYVFGSKSEVYPISIVEAMAAGVPFISTNVGCVKFLPGGVVVKRADEMSFWLDFFSKNEETRSLMGLLGHKYALQNLSIESKSLKLLSLIES